MNLWIAIAARPPEEGKTRLAPVLSPDGRTALNLAFFDHVLSVAVEVAGADHCVVVSRADTLLDRARRLGAHGLNETGNGLNEALCAAARFAQAQGADALLTISSDLPLLEADDLRAMIAVAGQADVVIAADRHGAGTNALLQRPPGVIGYHHGPDSLQHHRAAAEALGLSAVVVDRPKLAFDVDTPEDITALRSSAIR